LPLALLLLADCSKRSRMRDRLERSETLLSKADSALRASETERARTLYLEAIALAESLKGSSSIDPGLENRVSRIVRLAKQRSDSVRSPEACVLSLFEALRTGDHEGFQLMSDFEALAEMNKAEPWWPELSHADRDRLLSCIEACMGQWMSERLDAFRALQQTLLEIDSNGDEATAGATLRSPAGEVGILYHVHRRDGRWRITDFRIPDLNVSLEDYIRETLRIASKETGSIPGLLRHPNAERLCAEAFETAEGTILDVDESLVGRTVAVKTGPPRTCTVIKQTVKEDGEWLLISESEKDLSSAQWVAFEDVEVIDVDAETWGLY